jgi:hypothetical protein
MSSGEVGETAPGAKQAARKYTKQQTTEQMIRTAFFRKYGYRLPHGWMMQLTSDLDSLKKGSDVLASQENHGLPPINVKIMTKESTFSPRQIGEHEYFIDIEGLPHHEQV